MNDPAAQSWLDAIYSAVRVKQDDYYEDSITLLCLLAMTGNFWDPTQQAGATPRARKRRGDAT